MIVQHHPRPLTSTAAGTTVQLHTPWRPRNSLELATQQLEAVERFHCARRTAEQAAASAAGSREMRMDSGRRAEALRRQHRAVVARTHEQLRASGQQPFADAVEPRVVLAHRSGWFRDKVARALHERGLTVVAEHDNGADALGESIAEQPDLLLVEDTLAMLSGEQVVREVQRLCAGTLVVAQVPDSGRVGPLLGAGAVAVHTRRVPPLDVALGMELLLAPA